MNIPNQNWIINENSPILRTVCGDVSFPLSKDDNEYIDKMVLYVDACYEKKHKKYNIQNGIALAAPQVGLTKKIIYVHFNEHKTEHKYLLANPKIISESMQNAYISDGEGCLSVNQKIEGIVKRKNKIIVKAYDINHKKEIKIEANGILAICLQHEIDHLNGILYIDKIDKTNDQSIISQWIKY